MTPETAPKRTIPLSILHGGKTPESVQISLIIWKGTAQIPGDQSSNSVRSSENGRPTQWTLTWLPRLHVFEILYVPLDVKQPAIIGYVDQSNAQSWRP